MRLAMALANDKRVVNAYYGEWKSRSNRLSSVTRRKTSKRKRWKNKEKKRRKKEEDRDLEHQIERRTGEHKRIESARKDRKQNKKEEQQRRWKKKKMEKEEEEEDGKRYRSERKKRKRKGRTDRQQEDRTGQTQADGRTREKGRQREERKRINDKTKATTNTRTKTDPSTNKHRASDIIESKLKHSVRKTDRTHQRRENMAPTMQVANKNFLGKRLVSRQARGARAAVARRSAKLVVKCGAYDEELIATAVSMKTARKDMLVSKTLANIRFVFWT